MTGNAPGQGRRPAGGRGRDRQQRASPFEDALEVCEAALGVSVEGDVDGPYGRRTACRVGHTTINCRDAFVLSEWCKLVRGDVDVDGDPNKHGDEECMQVDTAGAQRLLFIEVEELQHADERIHFDLVPSDRRREDEITLVVALGATEVAHLHREDETGWKVLADPAGNLSCILRSDEERRQGRPARPSREEPHSDDRASGIENEGGRGC
jgi:hypothetical protein